MKVVLLAGGFGTRLAEYTESIPKPMVLIGGRPILWHIMQHYAALGTRISSLPWAKAQVNEEYFLNYRALMRTPQWIYGVVRAALTNWMKWTGE